MEEPEDNVAVEDAAAAVEAAAAEPSRAVVRVRAANAQAVAIRAGGGVTTQALTPYLVPQRVGDPLGLGIGPGERPPAPPDPDKYDRDRENA